MHQFVQRNVACPQVVIKDVGSGRGAFKVAPELHPGLRRKASVSAISCDLGRKLQVGRQVPGKSMRVINLSESYVYTLYRDISRPFVVLQTAGCL